MEKVSSKALASWLRQWSAMQTAGLSQLDAMTLCVSHGHSRQLKSHLLQVIELLQQGRSMSEALARQDPFFPPLLVHLCRAAEQSGRLDDTLQQMADYYEQRASLLDRIKSSLMYPLGVLLLACTVVAVILIWVVPVFEENFKAAGAALPAPTQLMVSLSKGLSQSAIPVSLSGLLLYRLFINQPRWRDRAGTTLRNWQLHLPTIGPLARNAVSAQWAQTLAALLNSGVPLLDALDTLTPLTVYPRFADANRAVKQALENGATFSSAIAEHALFPPMLVQMCAIGEESGNLPAMLGKAAGILQAQVQEQLTGLSKLLEPLIICFLGVTVGSMLMALYLPMFQMGHLAG